MTKKPYENLNYEDAALVFKTLGNANRLKVFTIIHYGHDESAGCRPEKMPELIPTEAVCVCEILEQMDVSGPTLSHHLKELRNAGLVDVYHHGQWSYYVVNKAALSLVDEFFGSAITNIIYK